MIPFIEYYMLPPDPYVMTRSAGTDQRNCDLLAANMKRFFPEISKEEYENYVGDNQIFYEMLDIVRRSFQTWYSYDCTDIFLNNNYQKSFNSYAYVDRINPTFIHVDQLLETIILNFLLVVLKWAKELENNADGKSYFKYLIYLLNELCIFGELPSEGAKAVLMEKLADDSQIINLASDCHWGIMVFTVAHEIAHAYQMDTNPEYWEGHPKESEFDADAIAYDILLRLITDGQGKNLIIQEYAYLAPMMYMDFFNLYYYTDYILYGTMYSSQTHPTPDERKAVLFTIVEREIYQLDTVEGNVVYQWFCWVYDMFMEKLPEYKRKGKLDSIIHDELRKKR